MNFLHIWPKHFLTWCLNTESKGESVYESIKTRISVFYSPLGLLDVSPIGFQSWLFWASSLQCNFQELELGCLMWGLNPLFLRNTFLFVRSLPLVGYHARGKFFFFCKNTSLTLLSVSIWPFYPVVWRSCSTSFQAFFRENWSICSYRIGVYMGGSEFRVFLHPHLLHVVILNWLYHASWVIKFTVLFLWSA